MTLTPKEALELIAFIRQQAAKRLCEDKVAIKAVRKCCTHESAVQVEWDGSGESYWECKGCGQTWNHYPDIIKDQGRKC